MGSSAALTTSLVASLLQFFGVINLEKNSLPTDQSVVHNLGQLIHSVAQGKIGSGFDVAAAVYGSQFYRRFSDTNIPFDRLINNDPTGELLYSTVRDPSLWNQSIVPFHLPVGMDIVMGDVCGGSSSSSMVVFSLTESHHLRQRQFWPGRLKILNMRPLCGIEFARRMKEFVIYFVSFLIYRTR